LTDDATRTSDIASARTTDLDGGLQFEHAPVALEHVVGEDEQEVAARADEKLEEEGTNEPMGGEGSGDGGTDREGGARIVRVRFAAVWGEMEMPVIAWTTAARLSPAVTLRAAVATATTSPTATEARGRSRGALGCRGGGAPRGHRGRPCTPE
jgi:hypothetical protein